MSRRNRGGVVDFVLGMKKLLDSYPSRRQLADWFSSLDNPGLHEADNRCHPT
jgi:hypothetical protein